MSTGRAIINRLRESRLCEAKYHVHGLVINGSSRIDIDKIVEAPTAIEAIKKVKQYCKKVYVGTLREFSAELYNK